MRKNSAHRTPFLFTFPAAARAPQTGRVFKSEACSAVSVLHAFVHSQPALSRAFSRSCIFIRRGRL